MARSSFARFVDPESLLHFESLRGVTARGIRDAELHEAAPTYYESQTLCPRLGVTHRDKMMNTQNVTRIDFDEDFAFKALLDYSSEEDSEPSAHLDPQGRHLKRVRTSIAAAKPSSPLVESTCEPKPREEPPSWSPSRSRRPSTVKRPASRVYVPNVPIVKSQPAAHSRLFERSPRRRYASSQPLKRALERYQPKPLNGPVNPKDVFRSKLIDVSIQRFQRTHLDTHRQIQRSVERKANVASVSLKNFEEQIGDIVVTCGQLVEIVGGVFGKLTEFTQLLAGQVVRYKEVQKAAEEASKDIDGIGRGRYTEIKAAELKINEATEHLGIEMHNFADKAYEFGKINGAKKAKGV
ncbi:hypothetical protein COCSUDRAFT_45667 [Coccomyxa subellipsoidea C-169]|uniref:Uncharacterized protein n=1 Tax=Coccomyxa subellipsoidea (strain C-169) TaxID=574566 RepID=I0YI19_COCSC|nr:hypothetical protein COCSUDRAFT_45667 [Coccomyxa subellipsoidea C-169]EIE18038.1 hypothetical protein COCSUDRAFT_45667 [Coccomyxa subellipsoidea C-169]|eukprot:XP_005642582.1 hypothetical protein COCSUDRAFT_45667 [Coccomyxa subellipsoidea C-169]